MPIYEYQCADCDHVVEVRQSISEDKLTTCAEAVDRAASETSACGSSSAQVQRLISNTSFVLKGSGWYKTDYAGSNGAANATKKEEAASTASSDGGGTKSETGAKSSSSADSGTSSGASSAKAD